MWGGILLITVTVVTIAAVWIIKSKKRNADKVTYACTHCGEIHCDCHLEDEN